MRKDFTVSERVAIALAVAERLKGRQGERNDLATSGNISGSGKGETRDIAAAKAGTSPSYVQQALSVTE